MGVTDRTVILNGIIAKAYDPNLSVQKQLVELRKLTTRIDLGRIVRNKARARLEEILKEARDAEHPQLVTQAENIIQALKRNKKIRASLLAARRADRKSEAAAEVPPIHLLKEGIFTTFGNQQTWTLKNGQPVRIS